MNVCMLFGAGVERAYKLPSGNQFFFDCLFPKKEIVEALLRRFKGCKYLNDDKIELKNVRIVVKLNFFRDVIAETLMHGNRRNVISSLSEENKTKLAALLVRRKKFYDTKNKDKSAYFAPLKPYFSSFDKNEKDRLFDSFEKLLSGETRPKSKNEDLFFYEVFCKGKEALSPSRFAPINITREIDTCFHSILSPKKYGYDTFSKVFFFYWACYFSIVGSLVKQYGERNKDDPSLERWWSPVKSSKKMVLHIDEILQDIRAFSRFLRETVVPGLANIDDATYAYLNQKLFENGDPRINFTCAVTTNYTHLANRVFLGLPAEKQLLHFLNGDVYTFELPDMTTKNALEDEIPEETIFFPFMFGQALIRPAVNYAQLETLLDAKNALRSGDCLLVYGHGLAANDSILFDLMDSFLRESNQKKLAIVCDESTHRKLTEENPLFMALFDKHRERVEFIDVSYEDVSNQGISIDKTNVGKVWDHLIKIASTLEARS